MVQGAVHVRLTQREAALIRMALQMMRSEVRHPDKMFTCEGDKITQAEVARIIPLIDAGYPD